MSKSGYVKFQKKKHAEKAKKRERRQKSRKGPKLHAAWLKIKVEINFILFVSTLGSIFAFQAFL